MFKPIDPKQSFPKLEEEVLKFWRENQIFQKSLDKNDKKNKFVFYEGPPTANGKPGIHHVLARSFKDIICRYKTMRGFYVARRAGWDTHGLPVELEVEKQLGLKNKKEIEKYGVAEFNKKCKESVFTYRQDWEQLTERMGFWLDMNHPYVTYENAYIEKVWGVLKQIWDKNLIYEGYKVVPYCPRCGTTLSSHELAQGYKKVEDESVYIKFKLITDDRSPITYLLVWTTTPWTLPGNIALAINKNIDYVKIKIGDEGLILAKDRLKAISGSYEIIEEFKGEKLFGLKYVPLYENRVFIKKPQDNDFQIWTADFVNTKEGTGIVHIAPAFGEDDMILQNKEGFSIPVTVDESGKMLTKMAKGKFVKDADQDIKIDLKDRNLLYKEEKFTHDYPFCWRCDSPLIYYAKSSWFISMSKLRDKLSENNETINWIPAYIKEGRFGEWIAEAKDWAISRERFWGTPLPIWRCSCGYIQMIGSLSELKEKATTKIIDIDLHKPYIDKIKIKCSLCGNDSSRVSEIIDAWFDSGAMPFASGEEDMGNFPADFISEAMDQTRGWFYTSLAIATALNKPSPYKNVISLGLILDDKGKKMSKSRGNILDPLIIANKYGMDSVRWFFYTVNNPGDTKRMAEKNVAETLRKFGLILWNVYSFFITYANIDKWQPKMRIESDEILDQWILSRVNEVIIFVAKRLDQYDVISASRAIQKYNDDLSTWYLRRTRKRRDQKFYSTLYICLKDMVRVLASFSPFIAEEIYQNLKTDKDPESVHLSEWPMPFEVSHAILERMEKVRELAEKGLALRAEKGIRVRQPLAKMTIDFELEEEYQEILKEELNVLKIEKGKNIELDTEITPALKKEGMLRDIIRAVQDTRKKAGLAPGDKVNLFYIADKEIGELIKEKEEIIKKETNLTLIKQNGENFQNEYNIVGQVLKLKVE